MSNFTEKLLRRRIIQECEGPHWQPIEAAEVGAGIPDLNGCYYGIEIWVELKILQHVKEDKVDISPRQILWHEARQARGGRTWILAANKDADKLLLWRGEDCRAVSERGVEVRTAWDFQNSGRFSSVMFTDLQRFLFQTQATTSQRTGGRYA